MDTRQLTYFLAVVDHQGFTAASAALRITQPALSNTVKQLEKECGVPLLHRGARGTRPTEAGKQLATDARRILHDLASTKARMRSIAQGRRGQVTLSVAPAFEWWHLPHALNIVESAAPDIDIDLRDPSPDITLRTLHEGVIDLGVVLTSDVSALRRIHGADLSLEPLLTMPLVVLLPRSMDTLPPYVSLADLASETWLVPARYPGLSGLPELLANVWRERPTTRPAAVTEVSTLQTCVPLVAAGRGVALVPEQVREIMGAKCVIRKVRESVPQQTAVVGWRTQQSLSPAALRVKDVLLDPATWARPGDAVGPDPALEQEQSW